MGQKYKFTDNNIISFEMAVKLQYKNCEMKFKQTDHVYKIDAIDISEKGYIVEFSETFLAKKKVYPNLLNYLNTVVDQDFDIVYKKLQNKKNLRDVLDCNN